MAEDWEMLKHASFDQVHQKYRMKQMPELFDVQNFFKRRCFDEYTFWFWFNTFFQWHMLMIVKFRKSFKA